MLTRLIDWGIAKQERTLKVSMDHLRHVARVTPSGFMKLAMLAPLGNHHRRLPREAFHLARLAATLTADCGACVQITLNIAQQEGVAAGILKAGLRRELGVLSPELADVFAFAEAVAQGQDDFARRERIRTVYGEEGVVELSLAIAASMVFPTLKRALGYAESCSLVRPSLRDEHPGRDASEFFWD